MESPVPVQIRNASDWAWRFLVIAAAISVGLVILLRLQLLFGVIFASMVATAILLPLRRRFEKIGMSRGFATGATIIIGVLTVTIVLTLVIHALHGHSGEIGRSIRHGVDQVRDWLRSGPLKLTDQKLDGYIQDVSEGIQTHRTSILSGVAGATSTAIEILSAAFLTLFTTIFFLRDGHRIWNWMVNLLPQRAHSDVHNAGELAWTTFTGYVRGTAIIAFVDATTIGIGIALVGVPLALPLAVLIFFGAFIPIIGALVTGFVAVAIALATQGVTAAVIVLLIILAVQQLEGHILQPVVMGHSVHLHPLAIVLSVTAGSVVAGIPGAIVAVPVVAITNTSLTYYGRRARGLDMEEVTAKIEADAGPEADKPSPEEMPKKN